MYEITKFNDSKIQEFYSSPWEDGKHNLTVVQE